jgi:hypothetical protein
MEFKIELKDIEQLFIERGKIITNKDGKKMEYIFENNIITDVNPYDENRIAEEKINNLLGNDERVKKINTIMKMTNRNTSNDPCYCVEDTLNYKYSTSQDKKDTEKVKTIINVDTVKKANTIINLDKAGILNEIAEKNREKIAANLEEEKELDEVNGDDRAEKIRNLEKMIEKLKAENNE